MASFKCSRSILTVRGWIPHDQSISGVQKTGELGLVIFEALEGVCRQRDSLLLKIQKYSFFEPFFRKDSALQELVNVLHSDEGGCTLSFGLHVETSSAEKR
jgi:hypothetical protein